MALKPDITFTLPTEISIESLRLPEDSTQSHIILKDSLITTQGKVLEWNGHLALKTAGDVIFDSIPNTTSPYPNVLAYDPDSKRVYYQGDYTGTVKGIYAGSNIRLDVTNEALPTVHLQNNIEVETITTKHITLEDFSLPIVSGKAAITFQSPVECVVNPTQPTHLVRKSYLDDNLADLQEELTDVAAEVSRLDTGKVSVQAFNTTVDDLSGRTITLFNNLNSAKANKATVDASFNDLTTAVATKAEKSYVDSKIVQGTTGNITATTNGNTTTIDLASLTAQNTTTTNVRVITVDTKGRVISATGGIAPLTQIVAGTGINVTSVPTAQTPTVALATIGSYSSYSIVKNITVDQYGRVTAVTTGTKPIVGITGTAGQTVASLDGGTDTATVGLAVVPSVVGTYKNPTSVVVDAYGRITSTTSRNESFNRYTSNVVSNIALNGYQNVLITVVGGGGGGGGANASWSGNQWFVSHGGGGGSGFRTVQQFTVQGSAFTINSIVLGAGGAAGGNTSSGGADGGITTISFTIGSKKYTLSARGGKGGGIAQQQGGENVDGGNGGDGFSGGGGGGTNGYGPAGATVGRGGVSYGGVDGKDGAFGSYGQANATGGSGGNTMDEWSEQGMAGTYGTVYSGYGGGGGGGPFGGFTTAGASSSGALGGGGAGGAFLNTSLGNSASPTAGGSGYVEVVLY